MIGRTISHYKITEKLGEGGMGVVYKAEDTKLERTVALKFLAGHLLNDEEAKARFLREAKAAAGLHHPNICPVYEISEAEGRTFLSMAFIKGESLEARIEQGPLPLKEALDIGRQIAEGLEAAHEEGVVHRDIKPANVIVDAKSHATIMDFGLAQLTEASRLTRNGQTMGTTAYMSPEQCEGSGTDHRTDVWSLGVVLYEMVVGERPFKGDYDKAVMYSILNEGPEPITSLRTGVPMELEVAVNKALAKSPEERYQNTSDFVVDLRTLAEKLKSSRSRLLTPATTATPSDVGAQRVAPARWLSWSLFAVATAVALVLAFVHLTEPTPERPVRRFSFTPESLYPGFPFWPSWSVYDSRLPAAMQRFSHCCQVRYSFRCRSGLRMLADHGVPAKPESPLATPLPRRPSVTRVRWLSGPSTLPSGHR